MKDYVNLERRFFAYKKTSQPGEEIQNILNGNTESGYVPFKPFLILNNAVQPPQDVLSASIHPDVETRKAIRKGAKGAFGNASIEALQASQYVGQCLCNVEEAGLSWEDLLSVNTSESQQGVLNEGVGFEGYMQKIAKANAISMEDIANKMNKSGQIMTKFVQQVFGYAGTWNEFIYDLDPKCIITLDGLNAITGELPVAERLRSSFLNPNMTLYHPERYLQDDLASLMHLYTGETPTAPVNTEVKIDDAFRKPSNDSEEPEDIESEEPNTASSSQSNTTTVGNTGLTIEAIKQLLLEYAEKANVPIEMWGNFINDVLISLGVKEAE
jgi:hypothetical protein